MSVQATDAHQKIYTKIQLSRTADAFGNPIFTERSGNLSTPTIIEVAESYGIDSEKIIPAANPDGVAISSVFSQDDPYAEITNATRLVDENYEETAEREALKYEKIPTAYKPTTKIIAAPPTREPAPNSDLPNSYEIVPEPKNTSAPDPQFGETLVKSANNLARTKAIPPYYTGHKIEFITSFSELAADHEIFQRHGNISMERRPNGIFSYLLGDFTSAEVGQKFLAESLSERYPSASLITYESGKRVTHKSPKKVSTKPVSAPPR